MLPYAPFSPSWFLNVLAMARPEGQPYQGFAQKSVKVQDAQPAQKHSRGYLRFSTLCFLGRGLAARCSFPPALGTVVFLPGQWGVFGALPFPNRSPASRQQMQKLRSDR